MTDAGQRRFSRVQLMSMGMLHRQWRVLTAGTNQSNMDRARGRSSSLKVGRLFLTCTWPPTLDELVYHRPDFLNFSTMFIIFSNRSGP
jgi:hypothetical protein